MSNGWAQNEVSLFAGEITSGVVTNNPVSKEFSISCGGATVGIVIKIAVSAVTVVGSVTPKLQTAIGNDWIDVKSGAAITVAGNTYIRLMSTIGADAAVMPLLNKGRIVVTTTNAGDTVTISGIEVLQEL